MVREAKDRLHSSLGVLSCELGTGGLGLPASLFGTTSLTAAENDVDDSFASRRS